MFWSHACSSLLATCFLALLHYDQLQSSLVASPMERGRVVLWLRPGSSKKQCCCCFHQELKTTIVVTTTTTKCLSYTSMHLDMRLLFYDCYVVPLYRIHSHCERKPVHWHQLGRVVNRVRGLLGDSNVELSIISFKIFSWIFQNFLDFSWFSCIFFHQLLDWLCAIKFLVKCEEALLNALVGIQYNTL